MKSLRRLAVIGLLVWPLAPIAARAQAPKRVWRVGFLSPRSRPEPLEADYYVETVRGLSELGYVEGKNLVMEWRFAEGSIPRPDPLAADLVRVGVDIIVVDGTNATKAAQQATTVIPIVFGSAGDPVGNGLVESLARPGGNTTGVALLANDVAVKNFEMLRSIVPGLTTIAVLYNPENPYGTLALKGLRAAATTTGMKLVEVEGRDAAGIEKAFGAMDGERVGAFVYVPDAIFYQERRLIAGLAAKRRVPSMGSDRNFPQAGGLMSYGQSRADNYHRVAAYIDKILRGAKPADLPVEQPTKLELVINRKTATALGLTIPPDLLVLADKVIE